jgi:hypothetical protein
MDDGNRDTTRVVPSFPWQAYHRVLQSAHVRRWYYLQGVAVAVGRRMRSRLCSQVHKLNLGFC